MCCLETNGSGSGPALEQSLPGARTLDRKRQGVRGDEEREGGKKREGEGRRGREGGRER